MINPTHRRYPRTLAEAFPRYPEAHFEDDEAWDGHRVLECALVLFLIALPVFIWLV